MASSLEWGCWNEDGGTARAGHGQGDITFAQETGKRHSLVGHLQRKTDGWLRLSASTLGS